MAAEARVLIVVGHGRQRSLCQHLLDTARAALVERGAEVRVHDLLADGFDPVLRLEEGLSMALQATEGQDPLLHRYQRDLVWATAYLFIHPVWWFSPPANLKGWLDRVLADGLAVHHPPEGRPEPLLGDRRALVVQTFGADRVVDQIAMRGVAWAFWRRAVFPSLGIRDCSRLALYSVDTLSPEKLEDYRRRLRRKVEALLPAAAAAGK